MHEQNNILDITQLKPAEFRALDTSSTCAVIPFAPVEYHGDHLPLGTDIIHAQTSFRHGCSAFAESHPEWKFLFTPVVPLGADAVPHDGSLWVSPSLIREIAFEMASRFVEYGYRRIALFSGHGGLRHIVALEEAAQKLMLLNKRKKILAFVPTSYLLQQVMTPEFITRMNSRLPSELQLDENDARGMEFEFHGGRFETSSILAATPELMDDEYKTAPDHTPPRGKAADAVINAAAAFLPKDGKHDLLSGLRTLLNSSEWFRNGTPRGYCGRPSHASPEIGRAANETADSFYVDLLRTVLIDGKIPSEGMASYIGMKLASL